MKFLVLGSFSSFLHEEKNHSTLYLALFQAEAGELQEEL
jgi:hypothetical protein